VAGEEIYFRPKKKKKMQSEKRRKDGRKNTANFIELQMCMGVGKK